MVPLDLGDREALASALVGGAPFVWLDMIDPSPEDLSAIEKHFNLHPLAIEDVTDVHQRSKIDAYENFWFIVGHALYDDLTTGDLKTTEIAIFAGEQFVITIRHKPVWQLDDVEHSWKALTGLRRDTGAFVYTILDELVDDYQPFVPRFEARLEQIEHRILSDVRANYNSREVLADILSAKSSLQTMRHVVAPLQDVVARIARGDIAIFGRDEMVYYRDVGSRVKRLIARIDALNDMLTTTMNLNVSILANRQAEVSRQLTIIATIFLPLSYITGFFGQNFGFMVNRIESFRSFVFWGLGSEIVAVFVLVFFFIRRRWI
jgi:magnesium transporter